MEQRLDTLIEYHESPTYEIADTLLSIGYQIANCCGMKISKPAHDVLGILEPRSPIKKKFLCFRGEEKQRALYIGTLWLDNNAREAKPDRNWVLEVYGRDNIPKLIQLVKKLSEPRKVNVQIRLESEEPEEESYASDAATAFI